MKHLPITLPLIFLITSTHFNVSDHDVFMKELDHQSLSTKEMKVDFHEISNSFKRDKLIQPIGSYPNIEQRIEERWEDDLSIAPLDSRSNQRLTHQFIIR